MLTMGVDDDAVDVNREAQPETPKMPPPVLWTIIMVVVNDREYDGYLKHEVYIMTVVKSDERLALPKLSQAKTYSDVEKSGYGRFWETGL